jgi:enamine deaminase RidA (YjgF/YER057c/UK114 family)
MNRIVVPAPRPGPDMAAHYGWPQSTAIRAGDYQNLKLVLQVRAMIYDRIEYDALNRVYRQYVPGGPPARTVWSVRIVDAFKVQLDAVALT